MGGGYRALCSRGRNDTFSSTVRSVRASHNTQLFALSHLTHSNVTKYLTRAPALEHRYTSEQAYQILCQNVGSISSKELIKRWRKQCLERVAASNSTNSTSSSSHVPLSNDLLELMCSLMSHEYTTRTRTLRGIFESTWIQRMLRLEENDNPRTKQIVASIRQSLDKIT